MTIDEQKKIVEVLKHVAPAPHLPKELFNQIIKLMPGTVLELVITRDGKDFLLTYRKDENFEGWHFPGGFLGYRETFEAAAQRIAMRELGVKLQNIEYLDVLNYIHGEDPRAHLVAHVFRATTMEKPKDGQYFSEAPEPYLPHLPAIIKVIQEHPFKK